MTDPAVKHLIEVLVDDMRNRVSGGIERFVTTLAVEGGRKDFEEWAAHPCTVRYLQALKSLSETLPLAEASDHAGLAKAYGMMSGLNLAVRLVEDPTRVFPSIYDGAKNLMAREPKGDVSETYEASPEGEEQEPVPKGVK